MADHNILERNYINANTIFHYTKPKKNRYSGEIILPTANAYT